MESAMTTIQSTNQISPANERVYHQSYLLGDWKGSWTKNNQAVEFKVLNIRGTRAQVEYTHNGRTERGFGVVNGSTITYGNVMVATRDGTVAGLQFSAGGATMSALLNKQAAPADDNKLIGTWSGASPDNGQAVTFQVLSVDGSDAQVRYTTNGFTYQGTGTVYKNVVMFGKAQVSTDDGRNGKVMLQVGRQTFAVPVTKPQDDSSLVNKLA
ncbi:hypothetical protein [Bradyrhizobium sp. ARR65]|uniref:hypothetical protein n=1 Tax=Bradyrhizobium sp. ARR65 TaxID=1040989 RepID=UPI0005576085|nr:hypothetical protein [Bradyrhizobium sp. ARR65]